MSHEFYGKYGPGANSLYTAFQRAHSQADPRAKGFNYGAPLAEPFGKAWDKILRLADHLRHVAHETEDRSWKLDHAIRAVRHSCTHEERLEAIHKLGPLSRELAKFAPENGGDPSPNYSHDDLAEIEHHSRWWPNR